MVLCGSGSERAQQGWLFSVTQYLETQLERVWVVTGGQNHLQARFTHMNDDGCRGWLAAQLELLARILTCILSLWLLGLPHNMVAGP